MISRRFAANAAAAAAVVVSAAVLASCSSASAPASSTDAVTSAPAPTTSSPTVTPSATVTPSVKPVAATTPCSTNKARQAVLVRLGVQHLWMCERDKVVRDTPITSGIPGEYTSTPTGRYTVQALTRDTSLTLISGKSYAVKYWIPFDGPLFGFHDSSWQDIPYGSQQYKKDGSHGCIHMPLKSIRFLYGWADVGTKVRIRT